MSASIHRFEIHLADTDRAHYEEFELRLARHPSETERYLITRALAFCILHESDLHMTAGICNGDEPTIELRDSTGLRTHWNPPGGGGTTRGHPTRSPLCCSRHRWTHHAPSALQSHTHTHAHTSTRARALDTVHAALASLLGQKARAAAAPPGAPRSLAAAGGGRGPAWPVASRGRRQPGRKGSAAQR